MCGRYLLVSDAEELAARFDLDVTPRGLRPRYNIAPSQTAPVVGPKASGAGRGLVAMRWGLVPRFATGAKAGPRPINARSESAAANPAFRDGLRHRRCLVPADGFYEWERGPGGLKQPHWFRPTGADGPGPVAFAAVWDVWRDPADESTPPLYTFAVLTTTANAGIRPVHDRMPVVVGRNDTAAWLSPDASPDDVAALLRPCPDDWLAPVAVSPLVNSAHADGPECVTLAGEQLLSRG